MFLAGRWSARRLKALGDVGEGGAVGLRLRMQGRALEERGLFPLARGVPDLDMSR